MIVALLCLAACSHDPVLPAPVDTGTPPVDSDGGEDTGTPAELGCPEDMVPVRDALGEPAYCIDLYEAHLDGGALGERDQGAGYPDGSTEAIAQSIGGVQPTTVISWYQAVAACLNAGKYLCSSDEWRDACDGTIGDGGQWYPWGDDWDDSACALPLQKDLSLQYDGLQPTGSLSGCVSPVGAYDMAGNAWEWSDPMSDEGGQPMSDKRGGAYYSGKNNAWCEAALLGEHPPDFTGTIAARCCATPSVVRRGGAR